MSESQRRDSGLDGETVSYLIDECQAALRNGTRPRMAHTLDEVSRILESHRENCDDCGKVLVDQPEDPGGLICPRCDT